MSEERPETCKYCNAPLVWCTCGDTVGPFTGTKDDFIILQSEIIKKLREENAKLTAELSEARGEVERLREVLAVYADHRMWVVPYGSFFACLWDNAENGYEPAEKALKGGE